MLSRREFIGAGLGAVVAAHASALPGDKMRYAMSGHQFRTTLPHPESGIKMAAASVPSSTPPKHRTRTRLCRKPIAKASRSVKAKGPVPLVALKS